MVSRKHGGFTLIELMIVVALIAVIASMAIPNLTSARRAANESSAVATLRELSTAQAQFHELRAVDADGDGMGEYGCFGEISGITPLALRDPTAPNRLVPPMLGGSFQNIDANGVLQRSGYYFQVWLPDAAETGQPEQAAGAPNPLWDTDRCEIFWCCYAWPVEAQSTGTRAFFVNHRGEIYQTNAASPPRYQGPLGGPAWNAALTGASMSDQIGRGGALVATDGKVWLPVN